MKKLFVLVATVCMALGTTVASACMMPTVREIHNQTVDGHLTVKTGRRCNIIFRSIGPTESNSIARKPSHGTATVDGLGRIIYQSRRAYVGPDEFIYVRRGRDARNDPSVRTVRILVTVTP